MRKPIDSKIERLKEDLIRAREKANQWQARTRDIERQITEQENLAIVQAVRSVTAAPEDLRGLLDMIRAAVQPETDTISENKEAN